MSSSSSDNPWTAREKYELLKIQDEHHNLGRNMVGFYLHARMTRLRETSREQAQSRRSDREITSMIRELRNSGAARQDLAAEAGVTDYEAEEEEQQEGSGDDSTLSNKKIKAADRMWKAKSIVSETKTKYEISWEDDSVTGETYENSMEPHENASEGLVRDWERMKAKNKAKGV